MTAKRISTDKRVPIEVWERIFDGLYPSQLSRLSMVSKTLYFIVASLPIWTRLFAQSYPKNELRVLRGRSASTCCMIFMCAISLHFCEECERLVPFGQPNAATLPLSVLVTLPSTRVVTTTIMSGKPGEQGLVGGRINFNWRIRKCHGCRDEASTVVAPESIPDWVPPPEDMEEGRTLPDWKQIYPQLYYVEVRGSLRLKSYIKKSDVISHLNSQLGGPVGVEACRKTSKDYDAKTWSRIMWYRGQD